MTSEKPPILPGSGATDYVRYMRTDELLALQRDRADVVHRDELLFQTVHQSTELWLKLACHEATEAAGHIDRGEQETATRLLGRATTVLELVTEQLNILRQLAPADFQRIRRVLGNGSGFESPGWMSVQKASRFLAEAFDRLLGREEIDLVTLYSGPPDHRTYRLAEALVDWDEAISLWRVKHYKIATRIIGHEVVGTKGTPVDVLVKLIAHKFFPELWRVRTELTQAHPLD